MLIFDNNPLPNMFFQREYNVKKLLLSTLGARKPHRNMLLLLLLLLLFLVPSFCLVLQSHGHYKKRWQSKMEEKTYIYNMGRYSKHPNKKHMALWKLLHLMPQKLIVSLPPLFYRLPTLEFSWLLTLVLHHTFANCRSMPLNS